MKKLNRWAAEVLSSALLLCLLFVTSCKPKGSDDGLANGVGAVGENVVAEAAISADATATAVESPTDTLKLLLNSWELAYTAEDDWMGEGDNTTISYLFYDIDKDGVNELFVSRGAISLAVCYLENGEYRLFTSKWHDRQWFSVTDDGYFIDFVESYYNICNRDQEHNIYKFEKSKPALIGSFTEFIRGEDEDSMTFEYKYKLPSQKGGGDDQPIEMVEVTYEEFAKANGHDSRKEIDVQSLPGWKKIILEED